jgi:hypothetical protein
MTGRHSAQDAGEYGGNKPRNKRRYGGKNQRKNPSVMDGIRARRNNPPRDDDYLDDFDGDTEKFEEIEDFEDFDDDVDAWEFEDDEDR